MSSWSPEDTPCGGGGGLYSPSGAQAHPQQRECYWGEQDKGVRVQILGKTGYGTRSRHTVAIYTLSLLQMRVERGASGPHGRARAGTTVLSGCFTHKLGDLQGIAPPLRAFIPWLQSPDEKPHHDCITLGHKNKRKGFQGQFCEALSATLQETVPTFRGSQELSQPAGGKCEPSGRLSLQLGAWDTGGTSLLRKQSLSRWAGGVDSCKAGEMQPWGHLDTFHLPLPFLLPLPCLALYLPFPFPFAISSPPRTPAA